LFTLAKIEYTKSNTLGMDLFWTSTIVLEKTSDSTCWGRWVINLPSSLHSWVGTIENKLKLKSSMNHP